MTTKKTLSIKLIKIDSKSLDEKQADVLIETEQTSFSLLDLIRTLIEKKVFIKGDDSSLSFTRWNLANFFVEKKDFKKLVRLTLFTDLFDVYKFTKIIFFQIRNLDSSSKEKFVSIDFGSDLFIQNAKTDFNVELKSLFKNDWFLSSFELEVFVIDFERRKLSLNQSLNQQSVSNGSLLQVKGFSYEESLFIKSKVLKEESLSLKSLLNSIPPSKIEIRQVEKVVEKIVEKTVPVKSKESTKTSSWFFSDKPFFTKEGVNYYLVSGSTTK